MAGHTYPGCSAECVFVFQGIFIFSMIQYRPLTMAGHTYPGCSAGCVFVFQGIFIFSMIQYRPLTMAGHTYPGCSAGCVFVFQGIFIFSMIQYRPLTMAGYTYPGWAQVLGWFIALISVVCIPLGMIHAVYTAKGSNIFKVGCSLFSPTVLCKVTNLSVSVQLLQCTWA